MPNKDQAVRDAATRLMQAIDEARAEGYVVAWPASAEGLGAIAVSAGRKALTPDEIGAIAKAEAEREQAAKVVIVPAAPADPVRPSTVATPTARTTTLEKRTAE